MEPVVGIPDWWRKQLQTTPSDTIAKIVGFVGPTSEAIPDTNVVWRGDHGAVIERRLIQPDGSRVLEVISVQVTHQVDWPDRPQRLAN
jgi:hypothetical protein